VSKGGLQCSTSPTPDVSQASLSSWSVPLVTQFHVIRERSTLMDGYLCARPMWADGSQLEFSAYMQRSSDRAIAVITYSYHWTDANNELIVR
jgi:hypothetical protein